MKGFTAVCVTGCLASTLAVAAEPDSCKVVRFSDVGWTDNTMTTATTRLLLSAMGYTAEVSKMSVPATFKGLKDKSVDVFLGNWMPAQGHDLKPYLDEGSIDSVRANLQGAKYTLAVPTYAYDAGLKSFADIAKFGDKLDYEIHGIEPGNDGNALVKKMIAENAFGLGKFHVVESNENTMLASLTRAEVLKAPEVFLGWEPHPMNTHHAMKYLDGGDAYFGPNFGGATVYTLARSGYTKECDNVGHLLKNLEFSLPMEDLLMDDLLNQSKNPRESAKAWLQANGPIVQTWLAGVMTADGKPAFPIVKARLEIP